MLHTSSTRFNDTSLDSPGKLTTWSNLSKAPYQQSPPQPVIWQSRNREELNNNSSSEADSRRTKSLPDFDCGLESPKDARLVNAFIRGRSSTEFDDPNLPQMVRSKDTVNQYLKTNSKLTSIEEQAEQLMLQQQGAYSNSLSPGSSSSEVVTSGSTLRTITATNSPARHVSNAQRPLSLPPKPQIKFLPKSKSLSTPNGPKQDGLPVGSSASSSTVKFAYPTLDFLENDVGLWDTFFSHSKNSGHKFQSVLRPPLPIEEYLKVTKTRVNFSSMKSHFCKESINLNFVLVFRYFENITEA